jgi:chemotaxis protein methyltransferase CheR
MSHTRWLKEELIEAFTRLVANHTGIVIREQDRVLFCEKISLRAKATRAASPNDYYQLLKSKTLKSYQEWGKLIILLTNNESYFFRDKEQLNLLKNQIFPDLIKRKQTQKTIRICSAGCSTGQEPYTLGILLKELLPDFQQWTVLILGIDIDRQALEEAEKGVYEPWSFRGVDEEIKRQYFQKIDHRYHLIPDIKKIVKFQSVNLVKDTFPQPCSELREMDLILCRNVFIYFENSAIAKVLDKIYQTLQPSGYFLTGHTELSAQNLSQFEKIFFPESIVYQRPSERKAQPETIKGQNLGTTEKKPAIVVPTKSFISYKKPTEASLKKNSESTLNTNNIADSPIPKEVPQQPSVSEIIIGVESLLSQEKYELAIGQIQQALRIDSKNVKAHYFLAQIHANLGQYDKAVQSCQEALKIDSFAVPLYYLLAKIAEEQGYLEEAKRILKQIIYLEPKSVNAYLELSHIYKREGDLKRARKMQESSINLLKDLKK